MEYLHSLSANTALGQQYKGFNGPVDKITLPCWILTLSNLFQEAPFLLSIDYMFKKGVLWE
jgi:hypothetical protein